MSGPRAPLEIGGFADADRRRVDGAIRIPGGLSFLALNDLDAPVTGLDAFPRDEWPPVRELHLAFDAMVGTGTAMAAIALLAAALALRRRALPDARWFLRLLVASGPLGLVALESGWLVTEWGRQPWIVRGVAAHRRRGDQRSRTSRRRSGCSPSPISSSRRSSSTCSGARSSRATTPPRSGAPSPAVPSEVLLGGVIVVALMLYVLLAGADFGGGVWDLLAFGPRRARQRQAIEHAIGPIWEANHVWLILVVVVIFTAFPTAFAALSTALHVPLTLFLGGVVFRGSAFAFRSFEPVRERAASQSG